MAFTPGFAQTAELAFDVSYVARLSIIHRYRPCFRASLDEEGYPVQAMGRAEFAPLPAAARR